MKKAIILGGSSGIGKATAERFAREGWTVIIGSSNLKKARGVIDALEGQGHMACEVDVRNEKHIAQLRKTVTEVFGDFDVLINSVGISAASDSLISEFDNWDDSIQTMLYGTVKSCRALVSLIKNGGRIIHITSIHHERVEHGSSAYGMAKAAITQFTRSLSLELASRNILANTIAPGFINTPMSVKADGKSELETKWFKDNYIDSHHLPLKRAGEPEEVAGVVYFLAGPDASYITGSVLTVDGGLTITF
ncbi:MULTISPECIES: SDR family NAD(P)-dependent oxidoreductase [Pedobacter]|nr:MULTISPECIES: SDR family oxidoreductase [Pedobacter]MBB5437629.1 3-oxoacyl-[acyl-carrier protein] reductase [Pedobacter sp. AK017]